MADPYTEIAYGLCALLVVGYAWDRFNTPASNRSSTLRALYWSSCAGYIMSALTLFGLLSAVFEMTPWRQAILGPKADSSVPAPLLATLAMTTLLTSFPPLKRLDQGLLAIFQEWGAIPAEVKRRVAAMTPSSFSVTEAEAEALQRAYRDTYGEGTPGARIAEFLRSDGAEGWQRSEYRFTRVVKLYDQFRRLATLRPYARFFADSAAEIDALDQRMARFLTDSLGALTLAARFRAVESGAAYEEVMQERRETFASGCQDMFRDIARLLARAVLRSEGSECDIVRRLRGIGFSAAEPMNTPSFPINSLTVLALALFGYLFAVGVFFSHLPGSPHLTRGALDMAWRITVIRLATVGVTIWLMQHYAFFRREAGEPLRVFAYVVAGLIAAVVTVAIYQLLEIGQLDPAAALRQSLPAAVLSGALCTAVALCCDDWPQDTEPPAWLRAAEAAGCAMAMAMAAVLVLYGDLLPPPLNALSGVMLLSWIVLPSILALVIGGFVPQIYRAARRAATRRRREALMTQPGAAPRPSAIALPPLARLAAGIAAAPRQPSSAAPPTIAAPARAISG